MPVIVKFVSINTLMNDNLYNKTKQLIAHSVIATDGVDESVAVRTDQDALL